MTRQDRIGFSLRSMFSSKSIDGVAKIVTQHVHVPGRNRVLVKLSVPWKSNDKVAKMRKTKRRLFRDCRKLSRSDTSTAERTAAKRTGAGTGPKKGHLRNGEKFVLAYVTH